MSHHFTSWRAADYGQQGTSSPRRSSAHLQVRNAAQELSLRTFARQLEQRAQRAGNDAWVCRGAAHRVRLARGSLAVGKDGGIDAVHHLVQRQRGKVTVSIEP